MRGMFFGGPRFVLLGAVLALAAGGIVMELWNRLMPELFGLHILGYWQAVGLLVLCRILFGGLRGRGGPGGGWHARWRERMAERWMSMTPEERERFAAGMRHGGWGRRGWGWGHREEPKAGGEEPRQTGA